MFEFVPGVHLERRAHNQKTARALAEKYGETVGVSGVLKHLNRKARSMPVPGRGPVEGFTWNVQDNVSPDWWPQGITTSADADPAGTYDGHRLVVVSWYSHGSSARNEGSRISFIDLDTLEYRHVLVVRADKDGFKPLEIHAGGIVWVGPWLHLAGTARGIYTCHVDDIVKVEPSDDTYDYRYVLPVRFTYAARNDEKTERLRYSFLSLDRGTDPPQLVAGEYGVKGQTTRLIRYPLDPETLELHRDEEGLARPIYLDEGVGHMQGAAVVGDEYYITVSKGRFRLGALVVGKPDDLRPRRWALPPGPEDISYWPQTDQFWSLCEYPRRRFVFAMDRARLRRFPTLRTLGPRR
ncbi:MAG: hypothetical protein JWO46_1754 [Nocardioidaceae bacterium]|nr:hypothetical protein [Nocardioidaceae bacterium]